MNNTTDYYNKIVQISDILSVKQFGLTEKILGNNNLDIDRILENTDERLNKIIKEL